VLLTVDAPWLAVKCHEAIALHHCVIRQIRRQ
jgi:hypothetical protein